MPGSTAEPVYVTRFTPTERAFHWVHALSFFALLATGAALYVPALTEAFGSRALLRDVHLATAVTWVIALVAVVILGDRRALRQAVRDLDMLDEDDSVWGPRRPYVPQGRFNAGQKRNAALTAAFAVLFVVSGLFLWYGARNNDFSLASAVLLHDVLTLISIVLVAGHLYLALVHPSTRHSLRGMTLGTVRADWAREHHAKWIPEERVRSARDTIP
jgi:formate dehydrogenase subunit gamma